MSKTLGELHRATRMRARVARETYAAGIGGEWRAEVRRANDGWRRDHERIARARRRAARRRARR